MTIAVTDIGIASSTSGATVTKTGVTVAAGATIIVAVTDLSTSGAGSVSDGTNTYTAVPSGSVFINNSSGNGFVKLFYSANIAAISGATITYTKGVSGSEAAISAFYATGLDASPVDSAATATAFGLTTGSGLTITSGTPAASGELMVGVAGYLNTTTSANGAGFATPPDTNEVEATAHMTGGNQVTADALAKTYHPTTNQGAAWGMVIAAFKPLSIVNNNKTVSITMAETVSTRKQAKHRVILSGAQLLATKKSSGNIVRASHAQVVSLLRSVRKKIAITSAQVVTKTAEFFTASITKVVSILIGQTVPTLGLLTMQALQSVQTTNSQLVSIIRRTVHAFNIQLANILSLRRSAGHRVVLAHSLVAFTRLQAGKVRLIQMGETVTVSRSGHGKFSLLQIGQTVTLRRRMAKLISLLQAQTVTIRRNLSRTATVIQLSLVTASVRRGIFRITAISISNVLTVFRSPGIPRIYSLVIGQTVSFRRVQGKVIKPLRGLVSPAWVGTGAVGSVGGGSPITLHLPTGWQPGDLHIAIFWMNGGTGSNYGRIGWTAGSTSATAGGGGDFAFLNFRYRIAQAGDSDDPVFTQGLAPSGSIGVILGYRKFDPAGPFELEAALSGSPDGQTSLPYATPTTLGERRTVLEIFGMGTAATGTPDPSNGWLERLDLTSGSSSIHVDEITVPGAATVPAGTHTFSTSVNHNGRIVVAIKPDTSVGSSILITYGYGFVRAGIVNMVQAQVVSIVRARQSLFRAVSLTIGLSASVIRRAGKIASAQIGQIVTTSRRKDFGKGIFITQTQSFSILRRLVSKIVTVPWTSAITIRRAMARTLSTVQIGNTLTAIKRTGHRVLIQQGQQLSVIAIRAFSRVVTFTQDQLLSLRRSASRIVRITQAQLISGGRKLFRTVSLSTGQVITYTLKKGRTAGALITQGQSVQASVALVKTVRFLTTQLISAIRRHIRAASGATEPSVLRSGNNVFLATIQAFDGAMVQTLRFITEGLAAGYTRPDDTPANTWYDPRIIDPGNLERTVRIRSVQDGAIRAGDITFTSAGPRGYSTDTLDFLIGWVVAGYTVVIHSLTSIRQQVADARMMFTGTASELVSTDAYKQLALRIKDPLSDLEHPLLTDTFAGTTTSGGTGTIEGNADLAGQKKQRVYGVVYDIEGQKANAFDLIDQWSDGPVNSIVLKDGELDLTLDGNSANLAALNLTTPAAGHYQTCLALGLTKRGAEPIYSLTADVTQGASSGARTMAQLAKLILLDYGISEYKIDDATVMALDSANNAQCGLLVEGDSNVLDVLRQLLSDTGDADVLPSRMGVYQLQRFELPSGDPIVTLEEDTIIRDSFQLIPISQDGRVTYRTVMRYARNYTPRGTTQVAGGATEDQRSFAANEWRSTLPEEDLGVLTMFPNATERTYDTCFAFLADAQAEAARHLALHGASRVACRLAAMLDYADAADLGSVVMVSIPRFGLDTGKLFRVIGREDDYQAKKVVLTLWGGVEP